MGNSPSNYGKTKCSWIIIFQRKKNEIDAMLCSFLTTTSEWNFIRQMMHCDDYISIFLFHYSAGTAIFFRIKNSKRFDLSKIILKFRLIHSKFIIIWHFFLLVIVFSSYKSFNIFHLVLLTENRIQTFGPRYFEIHFYSEVLLVS